MYLSGAFAVTLPVRRE